MPSQETFLTAANPPAPLAERLRPQNLDEFAGQEHLIGKGKVLRRMIEGDLVSSMIFWGPPGVGKTTLAQIIAHQTKSHFINFSAVTSGIKEIRQVMEQAESDRHFGIRTIVFVDEIHRFNKAQQDAFLPYVEKGSIILIGATTENPSFEVNSALLSRCRVFVLHALTEENVMTLLHRALQDERGFGGQKIDMAEDLLRAIAVFANGDARTALSTLEMVILNADLDENGQTHVTPETVAPVYVAAVAALRQEGRRALRPHQRAAQVHAQFRPGRGGLLAGTDAGRRRRPAVYRAARRAVRERGHRAGGFACAGNGSRGVSGVSLSGNAGMHGAPDAGGGVHGDGAEVERAVCGV